MREANESLEGLFGGIVEFAKRLERKMKLAEEAMEGLTLLNKAQLKRIKLSDSDIEHLREVWLEGRACPLYQAGDVQRYLDQRKAGAIRKAIRVHKPSKASKSSKTSKSRVA